MFSELMRLRLIAASAFVGRDREDAPKMRRSSISVSLATTDCIFTSIAPDSEALRRRHAILHA
ncbi:MAG: hypothetical protein ACLT98_08645 [Eggerthellaceae bacterium]